MTASTQEILDSSQELLSRFHTAPESHPQGSCTEIVPRLALPRPAWIEINLNHLRRNFEIINQDKPAPLQILSVVKDEAYGHGALQVARTALDSGATFLGLSTLEEAISLRERGIRARILLLGDRHESELPWCVEHDLTCCVSEPHTADQIARLATRVGKAVPIHVKVNTGMNRYGVRWNQAGELFEHICATRSLVLEGVLSHFAQSDEPDKTFALLQLARFREVLDLLEQRGVQVKVRHLCNSGGLLDLPQAHFDLVRIGLLALGVFPSSSCRRLAGITPVMTVKARIAAIQHLEPGDSVGYGMRYTAPARRRIAVLPLGYGDGFPRVRNEGFVLIHGQRAPIVGGIAMDAFGVDITEIPAAQVWDEVVVMGRLGQEEISVHEVARLKRSVSYDVLTGFRARLGRVYVGESTTR